jgi:hypothetical protein
VRLPESMPCPAPCPITPHSTHAPWHALRSGGEARPITARLLGSQYRNSWPGPGPRTCTCFSFRLCSCPSSCRRSQNLRLLLFSPLHLLQLLPPPLRLRPLTSLVHRAYATAPCSACRPAGGATYSAPCLDLRASPAAPAPVVSVCECCFHLLPGVRPSQATKLRHIR